MEDFFKFYADSSNKLLYSDILEKRKRIVEKMRRDMLKETTYDDLDEKNFKFVMTSTKLGKMVKLIDEEFFDNKLIKTFNDNGCCLSVCLGNTCGSTAGFCSWRKGLKPEERIILTLKMMPKVFIKSFKNREIQQRAVDNIPCDDILTCFFITVCHELVHAILFCNCKEYSKTDKGPGAWSGTTRPGNGHTKTFMSILNNRFGHKTFTHRLISGITVTELEKESFGHHNIKKGDIVILKTRRFDGSIEEKEVLILSAGKVQLKASEVKDTSRIYTGRLYNAILRKVTYPKELKTPILNATPTKKVTETDLTPKEEISPKKLSVKKNTNLVTEKPAICNKRNPKPPCAPGFVEKKRPNGSICCYKETGIKKTQKFKFVPKRSNTVKRNNTGKKVSCNKRNPNPPCAPGFIEKKRPNGATCCYKGK